MLNLKSQSGFTLIEIMLTLAIASLLAATAFAGQASFRARAQFLDAVERTRNNLVDLENQSTTGFNTGASGGTVPGHTFFGIRVLYYYNNSAFTVDTIYNNNGSLTYAPQDQRVEDFAYDAHFTNSSCSCFPAGGNPDADTVVFIQNPSSGKKEVYAFNATEADPLNASTYGPASPYRAARDLHVCNGDNSKCVAITVDPVSGAITRGNIP